MASIKIVGTFCNSGYGAANKATAMALVNAGLDISTQIINTPMSRLEFSSDADLAEIVKRNSVKKADINIVQLIPTLWNYGFQKGVKNVGYFFWESDRICSEWINTINNGLVDEVWVPCRSNYDALINSGIKKPVYVVPQYTKTNIMSIEHAKEILPIPGNEDTYRFYSIFQWSDRKDPKSLFQAYFNEFSEQDNVQLVVKTYGPSPFSDRRWIKEAILDMKEKSKSTAPVYLFGELLQPEQIDAIHAQSDCYITTTRGEGWNLPLCSAMDYNKQIITPKTGGIADWNDKESAYIIPHTLIPIDASGQAWGRFYESAPSQKWGHVEVADVQNAMRQAYNEGNDFSARSSKYADILQICNEENVVGIIKERLASI